MAARSWLSVDMLQGDGWVMGPFWGLCAFERGAGFTSLLSHLWAGYTVNTLITHSPRWTVQAMGSGDMGCRQGYYAMSGTSNLKIQKIQKFTREILVPQRT